MIILFFFLFLKRKFFLSDSALIGHDKFVGFLFWIFFSFFQFLLFLLLLFFDWQPPYWCDRSKYFLIILHQLESIVKIQISNYKQLHETFFVFFLTCHAIANIFCITSLATEDIWNNGLKDIENLRGKSKLIFLASVSF